MLKQMNGDPSWYDLLLEPKVKIDTVGRQKKATRTSDLETRRQIGPVLCEDRERNRRHFQQDH